MVEGHKAVERKGHGEVGGDHHPQLRAQPVDSHMSFRVS